MIIHQKNGRRYVINMAYKTVYIHSKKAVKWPWSYNRFVRNSVDNHGDIFIIPADSQMAGIEDTSPVGD